MVKARKSVKASGISSELPMELTEKSSIELLKALHLLTSNGALNADARRKLKQVNHLVQLIKPAIKDVILRYGNVNLVDVGAGKSYLGFIISEVLKNQDGKLRVFGVESRQDLVEKSKALAQKLEFSQMSFLHSEIQSAEGVLPERVHLLTALHACDTATDDAIILGIKKKCDYIALVPCCQAEVAQQLSQLKEVKNIVNELWQRPLHSREFGSQITNVIRCLVLESRGYQVRVTEFIGHEHSMKNEFIFAKRVQNYNSDAQNRLNKFLELIPVSPKLLRELF